MRYAVSAAVHGAKVSGSAARMVSARLAKSEVSASSALTGGQPFGQRPATTILRATPGAATGGTTPTAIWFGRTDSLGSLPAALALEGWLASAASRVSERATVRR